MRQDFQSTHAVIHRDTPEDTPGGTPRETPRETPRDAPVRSRSSVHARARLDLHAKERRGAGSKQEEVEMLFRAQMCVGVCA